MTFNNNDKGIFSPKFVNIAHNTKIWYLLRLIGKFPPFKKGWRMTNFLSILLYEYVHDISDVVSFETSDIS